MSLIEEGLPCRCFAAVIPAKAIDAGSVQPSACTHSSFRNFVKFMGY